MKEESFIFFYTLNIFVHTIYGEKMKKYKKYYCVIILCLFIALMSLYIYIGHYIYNIVISNENPYYFTDIINVSDKKKMESQKWYDEYAQDIEILSSDGYKLKGSYINQGSSVCIIMVHGYRNDKTYMLSQVKGFYPLGYDMLVVDLRGHGKSEGDYVGLGVDDSKDIQLWIEKVKELNDKYNIVLYGVSMGGVSILNDEYDHVLCAVSDSSYSDIFSLLSDYSSVHPYIERIVISTLRFYVLLNNGYDIYHSSPLSHVSSISYPILYIHGTYDGVVSISHMYDLYNHTYGKKDYYIVDEHHGECFKDKNYFNKIDCFVKKTLDR